MDEDRSPSPAPVAPTPPPVQASQSQPQFPLQVESPVDQVETQTQFLEQDHADLYDPYDYTPWNVAGINAASGSTQFNLDNYDGAASAFDYDPTMTFQAGPSYAYPPRQQLSYHLYTAPPPSAFAPTHFVADNLREELFARAEATHNGYIENNGLPEELQGYHTLAPLENLTGEKRKFGSWYSTVYRAVNVSDGAAYVLRRIESASISFSSSTLPPFYVL
jgi:PAB-dependent poly(A)-specific ribonuclease subunit 3